MRIQVKVGPLKALGQAVPVLAAFEGETHPARILPASWADASLGALIQRSGFRAAAQETLYLPHKSGWVVVVGLGKEKDLSLERVRRFAGTAAKRVRASGHKTLVLPVITHSALESIEATAQALAEGALLGLYRFDYFKTEPSAERKRAIDEIILSVERPGDAASVKLGAQTGEVLAQAVSFVRDLINGPSNLVTPTALATEARSLAKRFKLACTVKPFAQLKREGFGGIVGVAQGSAHPAQFIVLDYNPPRAKRTVALCGKGITFDTGGISLKTAAKMEQMKYDMSGAAAVLGTIKAAALLKLPTRIVGIIAATENMPSGTAQKPGDILKTLSGKTVEVLNTDAEGRLVLSDCLHYAKRFKPDAVIDIATLTGACVIALGTFAIGLTANNERLAQQVQDAGERTFERVWRMPLWDEYGDLMKSDIADLRNISTTGEAGTIAAAKFLQAFVGDMTWAHLDIAGTAWADKERPYTPKGAAGIGVRLLVDLLQRWN